jgi:hypothetical protein
MPNSSSNAGYNGGAGGRSSSTRRLTGKGQSSTGKAEVFSKPSPLVHPQGSPDVQAGPRPGFLDVPGSRVRVSHGPIRTPGRLRFNRPLSVLALNVAHYALRGALHLLGKVAEPRRRVDAEAGQSEGVGVPVSEPEFGEFWEAVKGLRR